MRARLMTVFILLSILAAPAAAATYDVGVFESRPYGFETRSYWIEGPDSLVVIDTQFTPFIAGKLIDTAEWTTGKKVRLAIVLHPNPDKFNGTATFQQRGIKVVTSAQVLKWVSSVHADRLAAFGGRYAPDYPTATPAPQSFGDHTRTLRAAGLDLTLHVLGAGCSEAHVVVEFRGHIFTGDLVANGHHGWLELGRTEQWHKRLNELKALKPLHVHPGRGASGDARLLDAMAAYLRRVSGIVAAAQPQGEPSDAAVADVVTSVKAAFPRYGYPVFLWIGVPAEWRRQARTR